MKVRGNDELARIEERIEGRVIESVEEGFARPGAQQRWDSREFFLVYDEDRDVFKGADMDDVAVMQRLGIPLRFNAEEYDRVVLPKASKAGFTVAVRDPYYDEAMKKAEMNGAIVENVTDLPAEERRVALKMVKKGYSVAIQFVNPDGSNFGDMMYFKGPNEVGPFMRQNPELKMGRVVNLYDRVASMPADKQPYRIESTEGDGNTLEEAPRVGGDFEIVVTAIAKDVEKDNYEQGAIGGRTGIIYETNVGTFGSFEEMIGALERQYNFPGMDGDWGAIDDGRITTNRTEDDDGDPVEVGSRTWERFKAGEIDLWLADYDIMFKFARTYTPDEREAAELFNIRTA